MIVKYDVSLIFSVAQMYYLERMQQREIATRINASRSTVSLILTEARNLGIVDVRIHNPTMNHDKLSNIFINEFNISSCYIIPTACRESENIIPLITARAVDIFNENLVSGARIGLAWGRTLHSFMTIYSSPKYTHSHEIIPLLGGSNNILPRYQLNEMVRQFSGKIHGTPQFINAPVLASNEEDYRLYMNSSSMKEIVKKWDNIDFAIVSCGIPPVNREFNGTEVDASRFTITQSPSQYPIGDICGRYYDINGNFLTSGISERIIAIPPNSLRKAKQVICVAGGIEKAYSILGALRTNTINCLITDEQAAEEVLHCKNIEVEGRLETEIATLFAKNFENSDLYKAEPYSI